MFSCLKGGVIVETGWGIEVTFEIIVQRYDGDEMAPAQLS